MSKKKDSVIVSHVENFTVSILDNGFTLEYSGYNKDEDWINRKLVVPTNHDLHEVINHILDIEGNNND